MTPHLRRFYSKALVLLWKYILSVSSSSFLSDNLLDRKVMHVLVCGINWGIIVNRIPSNSFYEELWLLVFFSLVICLEMIHSGSIWHLRRCWLTSDSADFLLNSYKGPRRRKSTDNPEPHTLTFAFHTYTSSGESAESLWRSVHVWKQLKKKSYFTGNKT